MRCIIRLLFLGPLFILTGTAAQAQGFGPDHVVVFPATASAPILVSAPVIVCWHGNPVTVIVSSSVQVAGNLVTLAVNTNWSGLCFAAGDSAVKKAVYFTLTPLPEGTYTLTYNLYNYGVLLDQESVSFAVTGAAAAIPTVSPLSLALLALLVIWVACRNAKRAALARADRVA